MSEKNNRNYLAWQEEMYRRGEVSRRLRMAVFCVSAAIVAVLIWVSFCAAAPTVLRCIVDEGNRWDAEQEGLLEAYDAEAFNGLMRAAEQLREGDAE